MRSLQVKSFDYIYLLKISFFLILTIYSLSTMIYRNQTGNDGDHWCHTPDQDIFVVIEAMGHNSHILPKIIDHPGYGHKLLYAYHFKLLNLLNISAYHKLEDFCQAHDPLEIWPVMIKNARVLSFLLFIVFCLVMGLTCWQLTGKPWTFPLGFYFCSIFPGGQYQSFIIRPELIVSIMGCTGILFALVTLNTKRYWTFILFSILSGISVFLAIVTKIQGLPFLCFIVAIFLFFPINESKFFEHISAKKIFSPASGAVLSFLIVYGWTVWHKITIHQNLPDNSRAMGLIIIVFCLLIFLSYFLRTRLGNNISKRMLSFAYCLLGGFTGGIMFVYLSFLPFHSWHDSLDHCHALLRLLTAPGEFTPYIKLDRLKILSFFYSSLLTWWNNYSFLLSSLMCFSLFFFFPKIITKHNKSIFILLILASYLYMTFTCLRYSVPHYLIFSDVFLILGFIYLFSKLSNLIGLKKVFQSCFIILIVAWMFLFSVFTPATYSSKSLSKIDLAVCIQWTYPSEESISWLHEQYIQCIQRAYPTKINYIENLKNQSNFK